MQDGPDGSSSAAQSAPPPEESRTERRGFFERLSEAISSISQSDDDELAADLRQPHTAQVLGLLNLRRMRVEDVMIPKAEITAVPLTITRPDLVAVFRESGLTRLPVFDGTLDTPKGFVNLKDFALRHGFNGNGSDIKIEEMLRPLLYVPPSMTLNILLQRMQAERIHMALVIDEYGGTDGLVTMEDLIEQVVGAIEDEHDIEETKSFSRESEGVYIAQARTILEHLEEEIGMDLTEHADIDEEEVDTLGGLVSLLAGHVPVRGEVIVHPDGPEFEVLDADPRRVKRLRVRVKSRADD